jgi:hypothetical protein
MGQLAELGNEQGENSPGHDTGKPDA